MRRQIVATTALASILAITTTSASCDGISYTASITVLDGCTNDSGQIPTISLTERIPKRGEQGAVQKPTSIVHEAQLWHVVLQLPRAHRYVIINTAHCATRISSVSVLTSRAYSAVLKPGNGPGSFEEREAAIYGLLPIDGVAGVDIVAEDSSAIIARAQVQGRAFYFEDVPNTSGRIRLDLQDYSLILSPIVMYDPNDQQAPFYERHDISLSSILDAMCEQ